MSQYTSMSQQAFDQATAPALTPGKAVDWIQHAQSFRTLPEKLLKFFPGTADEMKLKLRQGLNEYHPEAKERESIRKNVSNWFTPAKGIDDRTISRGYALEICFILGLTEENADALLRAVTGEGLHYRNLEEFIAAYGLRHGLPLERCRALHAEVQQAFAQQPEGEMPETFTRATRDALHTLGTESQLRAYIQEHWMDFSAQRNTAYADFSALMDVLQNDGTDATVAELVAQNLYRRFVQKNGRLSSLEKSIRAGWPEESQLARMRTREAPVTRKALILLYLAAGGGDSNAASLADMEDVDYNEDDYYDDDEDFGEETDEDFESLLTNLNAMLIECGFAALDPRLPFDWMVLFCMATGDVFDLDERFEAVLSGLFGNETQPASASF